MLMSAVRRTGAVSAAALSGLALTLGLAHAAAPRWAARAGLDVWNLPELNARLREIDEETARTRSDGERLLRQIDAAGHLTARLAEGSLTLAEAADELEPLLRDRPGFETVCAVQDGAPTFRHGVARYAIRKALAHLAGDPTRRAATAGRLEAEYAALGR
jgi:hypothetical protein